MAWGDDLVVRLREVDTGTSKFDLTLFLWESDAGLIAAFEYSGELFDRATDGAGHDFAAFLFPVHIQVQGSLEETFPQDRFRDMCRSMELPCLDLLPALRAGWADGRRPLYYDHCHLTPIGNEITAEALTRWIEEESLLP